MKRLIIPTLISLITINLSTAPAYATVDAIVLTTVETNSSEINSEDDLELRLKFNTPKTFNWNPTLGLPRGDVQVIYCPDSALSGSTCTFPTHISNYRIQNIDQYSNQEFTNYFETLVVMKAKINSGILGNYKLWSIRISGADLPNRYELHVYTRGKTYAEELTIPRTDIAVPDFSMGDFSIVEPVVVELEPEPIIESTPEPVVEETSDPAAPSTTNQTPITQPIIQSNFYLPALKGDENWKPMREIKGNFQDWKRIKKNSINGSMNQVTKSDGALITFTSSGDALTLRFLGGKKRGSFSIYVNGKFIERVDTKRNKKTQLMKTWEGLGSGKHFIDIVAELDNGQSLALNGIQSPRT